MSLDLERVNPLLRDPSIVIAREALDRDGVGQWLSVYACARLQAPHPDPLAALGLPLLDALLDSVADTSVSVTAVRAKAGGFDHWSLILTFAGGLRASLDLGAGLGVAQSSPLDLRIEWKGTERVIAADPSAVAVTVTTATGTSERSAEVTPLLDALLTLDAGNDPGYWRGAVDLVVAARRSAETGVPNPLT